MTDRTTENARMRVELEVCHNCVEDIDPDTCKTARFNSPSEDESFKVYYCEQCSTQNFANIIDSIAGGSDDESLKGLQKVLHDQLDEHDGHIPE